MTTAAAEPATTRLGGMLLASNAPDRLREWYLVTLAPTVTTTPGDPSYAVLDFAGFYVMLDRRDDVGGENPEPARVILNFEVTDAPAVAERIETAGTRWVSRLEDRDGSWFATATDPDGNFVQIIELSAEARQAMEREFS